MIKKHIFIKIILIAIFTLLSVSMLSANKSIKQKISPDFEIKVINKEVSAYRFFDKDRHAKAKFLNPELLYVYFKSKVFRQSFIDKTSSETDINKLDFIKVNSEKVDVSLQSIKYENSVELIFASKNNVRKLMLFLQVIDAFPEITVQENELIYFTYFDVNQLKYLIRKHYKISNDFVLEIDPNKVPEFKDKLFKKLLFGFHLSNLFGEKKEYNVNIMPVQDSENIFKIDDNFIDFEHFKIALNDDLTLNKIKFDFILDKNNLPVNTKIINAQKLSLNSSKEVHFDLHNLGVSFLYIKINKHKELILVKENESNANIEILLKYLKLNIFSVSKEFKQEITLTDDLNSLTIRKTSLVNEASKEIIDYKAELEKQCNKLNDVLFDSALSLDELKKEVLKYLLNKTIDVKIISKNSAQGQFVCEFFSTKKPDIRVTKALFLKKLQKDSGNIIDTEKQEQEKKKEVGSILTKYKLPFIIALLTGFILILILVISIFVWRKRKYGKKN